MAQQTADTAQDRENLITRLMQTGVDRQDARTVLPRMKTDDLWGWVRFLEDGGDKAEFANLAARMREAAGSGGQQEQRQEGRAGNGRAEPRDEAARRAENRRGSQRDERRERRDGRRDERQEDRRSVAREVASTIADDKTAYSRIGLIGALIFALLLWICLYCLNIYTTSWAAKELVEAVFAGLMNLADNRDFVLPPEISWTLGLFAGIGVSAIEFHMWRIQSRQAYVNIIPASFVDLFSSSVAIKMIIRGSLGGPANFFVGVLENTIYTLLAVGLALAPEPMIIYLGKQLAIRFGWQPSTNSRNGRR